MSENFEFSPQGGVAFSQYQYNTTILAQVIEDPKILDQLRDSWNNFIESGQVWALLVGFFLGYLFRTFLS